MNKHISEFKKMIMKLFIVLKKLIINFRKFLYRQFNRNIYTQILFTNIFCFIIFFIFLTMFYDFSVKHIVYEQIEKEILQKSTRVNYALLQQETLQLKTTSEANEEDSKEAKYEQIRFLSEIFDVKITIFDKSGNIVATSAQQEIVPGTTVDKKFTKIISSGETMTTKAINSETNQLTFYAAVPMGDSEDTVVNGILLEFVSSQIDNSIGRVRLFLIIAEILLLLVIIFVSIYQAMHISKPISRLSTYVAELHSGNYVVQRGLIGSEEIKGLNLQVNKLAEKIQRMEEQIQNVEDGRTKLFADISHELRTPLTTIQGFVEAIQDGVIKDKDLLDKYIQIIYSQTIHINRLIDDMLQLSRLESGSIKLEKTPLDLTAVTGHVVEYMESIAKSSNTRITFEKNSEQALIMGDIDKIEQIIKNLLQNAINATENGNIEVKIDTYKNRAILSIKDDGVGISAENIPHIWDRFYQSRTQRLNAKQKRGSGLGLAIVKHLVKLHEGEIEVESKIGLGTTFYIQFPSL